MLLTSFKSQKQKEKTLWRLILFKNWIKRNLMQQLSYFNPDQYNGACLLGLRSTVIKSHGAANQQAFTVAIEQAMQIVQRQIPKQISARLESVLEKVTKRTCIQKF